MEKEISSGAMLGIVLIALAAIIGLGFGVFAIAKGTANEGVTQVQENLGAVSQSAYTDYDQKIVTGTQVVSAYQNFEGKNVAVLVMTQATKDRCNADTDVDAGVAGGNGVDAAYANTSFEFADTLVSAAVKTVDGSGTTTYDFFPGVTDSKGNPVESPVFVNYNALLGVDESYVTEASAAIFTDSQKGIYFDTNCWRVTAAFQAVGGKVQFNNVSGNLSKSGMMEYVPSGARFQSYLIKDVSGTTMGVAFEQIDTN
jgi:hypothetical protein